MGQITSQISNYFDNEKPNEDSKTPDTTHKVNASPKQSYSKKSQTEQENESENGILSSFSFGIFATPRNPLKRSRQISPTTLPQSILEILSPAKKIRVEENYLNFPFLVDNETVNHYRKSKVMIILRGLPGSGKSTIAKRIHKKFISSTICSADNFFMVEGEYKYDRSLIRDAHAECQKNAINAVRDQTSVVIIDNTNLKLWEMDFYLDLASEYDYIPVIVESKTPWRREIKTLVTKTVHDLTKEIMIMKNNNFEELSPLYYGWFLNDADSGVIREDGESLLEKAYEIPIFRDEMEFLTGSETLEELKAYYKSPDKSRVLHCTAKYIGRMDIPENKTYRQNVEDFVGQSFDVEIVGYVLTPRTFGARIKLSDAQLRAWEKDDDEEIPSRFWDVEGYVEEEMVPQNTSEEEAKNGETTDGEEEEVVVDVEKCKENGEFIAPSVNGINGVEHEGSERSTKQVSSKVTTNAEGKGQGQDFGEAFENYLSNLPVEEQLQNGKSWSLENNCASEVSTSDEHNKLNAAKKNRSPTVNGSNIEDPVNTDDSPTQVAISPTKGKNGYSSKSDEIRSKKALKRSPRKQKSGVIIPENDITSDESVTADTIQIEAMEGPEDERFVPTSGKGSRAHLTLGCAPKVRPVTTGQDLIFAIRKEKSGCGKSNSENGEGDLRSPTVSSFEIEGTIVRNYGNGVWVFYPPEKIISKSIFTCGF